MNAKLPRALTLPVLGLALLAAACGGGGSSQPSITRPSSIPTATAMASLPEPILLGEVQATNTGTNTTAAAGGGVYTVKTGDTLGGIATANGIASDQQASWIAEVLRLNGIEDARFLRVGQELSLPRLPTPTATPRPTGTPAATGTPVATGTPRPTGTPAVTATTGAGATATATSVGGAATATATRPAGTPAAGGSTYTIVSGDYPYLIAEKAGVPVNQYASWTQQMYALNPGLGSVLTVGTVIQLPPVPR